MARHQWVYGVHAVTAVIQSHPESVLEVWVDRKRRDARASELLVLGRAQGLPVQFVTAEALRRRVRSEQHQGVAARVRPVAMGGEQDLVQLIANRAQPTLVLILDGVTDPHNLGACLRTSEAAGVSAVVVPKDRAASVTPTVRKVASGAAERIPVVTVTNLARSLRKLKTAGVWVYGMDQDADRSLYDINLTVPSALVLGAEGQGLRRLTREHCDQLVFLPMEGQIESLNVSVAAGVCLYEAVRQRWVSRRAAQAPEQA